MGATIFLYSWAPPAIDIGTAHSNPILFGASIVAGQAVGALIYLCMKAKDFFTDKNLRHLIIKHTLSFTTVLIAANSIQSVLFVYSTRLIDTAVTSLLELHPIIYIYLMARYVRDSEGQRRYARITPITLLFLGVAALGVTLVTLGTMPDESLQGIGASVWVMGLLLAGASAVFRSLAAFTFKWGTDLHRDIETMSTPQIDSSNRRSISEMDCVMFAYFLGNALSAMISISVGFAFPISLGDIRVDFSITSMGMAFLIGLLLLVPGNICFRKANLTTETVSINVLLYFTPFVSVIWLYIFTDIDIPSPDLVAMGAAAIVSANILLHLNPERRSDMSSRLGFRSLVFFIWMFGVVIYFRGEVLGSETLIWTTDYFGILTLSATVFTLLLSFQVSRLASRTFEEDEYTIALVHNLEQLTNEGILDERAIDLVLQIDTAGKSQFVIEGDESDHIESCYHEAVFLIEDARMPNCNCSHCQGLMDAKIRLDNLVHSKQYGNEFGEIVAIVLFGIVTIGLSVLAKPDVTGWQGFMVDQFSMVFAATICFLIFNLADMLRDRRSDVLRKLSSTPRHGIYFRGQKSLGFEGLVSIVLGSGIIAVFGVLFYLKWLA